MIIIFYCYSFFRLQLWPCNIIQERAVSAKPVHLLELIVLAEHLLLHPLIFKVLLEDLGDVLPFLLVLIGLQEEDDEAFLDALPNIGLLLVLLYYLLK